MLAKSSISCCEVVSLEVLVDVHDSTSAVCKFFPWYMNNSVVKMRELNAKP